MGKRTLLLGRAGTGKTRTVLDRVAGFLAEGREERVLLLVPTLSQASHLKRLLLSRYEDLAGFFDLSVVTFTGLAERVLPGRPIGSLLSGARRHLLLGAALVRDPPPAFEPLVRYPGFLAAALEFLKELKQNGLPREGTEELLARIAEEREGAVRERLLAFRHLLGAYEDLREKLGLLDHEDYLRETRDALAGETAAPGLDLELLAVDGFQNFTRLEREILLLLSDRAAETVVTLPYDVRYEKEEGRQFRVAHENYLFLNANGFARERLTGNRRAERPALARLEAALFDPEAPPMPSDGAVRVLQGSDPADEADRVARTVLRLVRGREGGEYAYSDVVVVVRDVRHRAAAFRAAFERHRIPLRVYAAEDVARAPYIRAATGLLRLAAGDWSARTVLELLRAEQVPAAKLPEVDAMEEALLEEPAPADPGGWIEWVRGRSGGAAEFLEEVAATDLAGRGLLETVDAHLIPLWRQEGGLRDVGAVRREALARGALARAASEVRWSLDVAGRSASPPEQVALLAEALRHAGARFRDRRLEVVNLIDAREARQWEARVAIVSGLVEGEFPRQPREDLFLPDRDREQLNRSGEAALGERLLQRDEERYLFYVAATRARDRLYLTSPVTDGSGEETLRSPFLDQLLGQFEAPVVSHRRLSDALPAAGEEAGPEDLRRSALAGLSARWRPGTPGEEAALGAAALHDLLVTGADDGRYRRAAWTGIRFQRPPEARVTEPALLEAFAARSRSASALDDFAACPFLHFARRTLRLHELPEVREPDPLTLGIVAHAAMQRLGEAGFPTDPDGIRGAVEEAYRELAPRFVPGLVLDRKRRELIAAVTRSVAAEAGRLAGAGYRPARFEAGFRLEVEGVALSGRVDRIDEGPGGGVLIDYKYSRRGFDKKRRTAAEEGAYLQLGVYLLALRDVFGLTPRGAWLYPLRDPKTSGYGIEGGPPTDEGPTLSPDDLQELLEKTRRRIRELDEEIRSGEIAVRPRLPDDCKWCGFADLCRVERWALPEVPK